MRRLVPYIRPVLPRILAGVLCALGASLAALAVPRVLQWLVNGPLTTGLATHDESGLWWGVGLVLLLGVAEAGLIAARRALILIPGTNIEARLRTELFTHLQDLPVSFHDRWPGGQLLSRSMSDLGLLRRWIAFGMLTLVVSSVTIVVGIGILVATGGVLGLIYLAGAIPMTVMAFTFSRRFRAVSRKSQDQAGDLATAVEESVHGIRVLKAFGRGRDALQSFGRQADELRGTELDKAKIMSGLQAWLTAIPELTLGVSLVVGVWMVSEGRITVGALVAFFATAAVVNSPVIDLGMVLSMTLNARTAVDRYFDVMTTPNTLPDPAAPAEVTDPHGELAFTGVHFRYGDAPTEGPGSADVLDGVDLVLPPGKTVALVGLTGSGKSTLAMLVPRLYEVTGGSVTVDGVDVRDMTREHLRSLVGVAFEDATLFSASVRDNVLLGAPDDARTDADLERALDVAQAGFAHELPEGVETTIGEEGMSLSGGQRQRIALARAIAARPRVLVLDDPLSALDVDTEAAIQARLATELEEITTLIVAHRPSTVALADLVAVLQDGRITAVGPHSELLATNEHYRYVISSLEGEFTPPPPDDVEVARQVARGEARAVVDEALDSGDATPAGRNGATAIGAWQASEGSER
ncbi:ABC transporter ATP-binding protein [Luteimicrobium album]|nr:ABC transporter ATP-binding protein [Luteimicrobium album]